MATPALRLAADASSDSHIYGDALDSDIAVRTYLQPLKKHLAANGATELWINKPGEIILEVGSSTVTVKEPALTFSALQAFAQAVAVYSPQQQHVGASNPLLSATLPDGERIQIVLPPAVEPGLVSMSIRIPGSTIIPLDVYQSSGAFSKFIWPHPKNLSDKISQLAPDDAALVDVLSRGDLRGFLIEAVLAKKNIGVVGDTGSGKTTLMKSMCQYIPFNERLVTIEDVRELMLPNHDNKVQLLYSKSGQGIARVTPGDLISSCMRMAPSRVLLAELRGLEAWDFLKLLTTGHSGSITSWHAESCALAFERFMFMSKENTEAASLARDELKHLVKLTLDVVVHIKREIIFDDQGKPLRYERYVDEVYFDPWAKMQARFGDQDASPVVAPQDTPKAVVE
jgi:type IV secretion system protein VirB11